MLSSPCINQCFPIQNEREIKPRCSWPDDAFPRRPVGVVLLLHVNPDVVVLVQLKPVHLPVLVPADRLQPHFIRILVIDGGFELDVFVKLDLAQILEQEQRQCGEIISARSKVKGSPGGGIIGNLLHYTAISLFLRKLAPQSSSWNQTCWVLRIKIKSSFFLLGLKHRNIPTI